MTRRDGSELYRDCLTHLDDLDRYASPRFGPLRLVIAPRPEPFEGKGPRRSRPRTWLRLGSPVSEC